MKKLAVLLLLFSVQASAMYPVDRREVKTDLGIEMQPGEKIKWMLDDKLGMFIHWGLYSGPGQGEWLMENKGISPEEYSKLAYPESGDNYFAAKDFDARKWTDLAKKAGMRYMNMVTEHHDGYALFDSRHPNAFTSMQTHNRDFVKEYVEACRAAGLKVGLYKTLINWRYPGYYDIYGTDCKPNNFGYVADSGHKESARLMKEELYCQTKELMTNYGKIDQLFWDGGWLGQQGSDADASFFWESGKYLSSDNEWPVNDCYVDKDEYGKPLGLMGLVRKYQPDIVVNPRSGWIGDYTCEEGSGAITGGVRAGVVEKCLSLSPGWGYNVLMNDSSKIMPLEDLKRFCADCMARNMCLLVNIGPDRNGNVPHYTEQRLLEFGEWTRKVADAIYGTRGGPWDPVDGQYGFAHKDNFIYVYFLGGYAADSFELPPVASGIKAIGASDLETGKKVKFANKKGNVISLSDLGLKKDEVKIIAIELNRPIIQDAESLNEQFKGANWISIDEESQSPNQWLCFRKEFVVDNEPTQPALIDIAVDSKYWLWINGKLVVFEGGLKRGPNPEDTYYDTIDVTEFLRKGDNVISLLVWYWGKDGFCHKSSGKSGLFAKLVVNGDAVTSDSTWKAMAHPAFGESSDPKPNFRLPESNVLYDARKELGNWHELGYDDSDWPDAKSFGGYPCSPWNKLHPRPFPNWKDSGIGKYEKLTVRNGQDTVVAVGKLPKNITVTPYIKIKAPEGLVIDIRSDNYKGGSEYNVRAEYVTKGGVQEFEMPNYVNGHNIIYTMPKGVKILSAGYRESRFNTDILGSFECSDIFYNKLWQKSLNTMNLNMRDAIQDPDRERSQWWGDAAIISGEIYYTCDLDGIAAVKKAIMNLVDWQKSDGTLFSPIPAGSWDKELPQQMLASVGKFGIWNYYLYTADRHTLEYVYPKVKKYLSLWNIDENGLVKHRSGGWDWTDWGENIDVAVLDNAWYCLALEGAIEMARVLGDDAFANYYASQLQLVRDASTKEFWKGDCFRSKGANVADDRANGLAILAGFVDKAKEAKVVDFLSEKMGASPYMEKYILEALFSTGHSEEALARMKQRYSDMVISELTTLWEDWEVGGAGGGSINHGWAGGALSLLPQYVAGISPYGAGWEAIIVKPQLGGLKWVDSTVPVRDAKVRIMASHDESGRYEIEVKNGSESPCIVAYPKSKINGDKLIVNGVSTGLSTLQTASIADADDEYFYFFLQGEANKISNM